MLKWWQYYHNPLETILSGFSWECLASTHFNKDESILENFGTILVSLIEDKRGYRGLRKVPEPGVTNTYRDTGISRRGHMRLVEMISGTIDLMKSARAERDIVQAINLLRDIFGPAFPEQPD